MRRWIVTALLAVGCQQNSGLGYRVLDVEAAHTDGSAVEGFPEKTCTTLPILLGSRASARFPLGDGSEVNVDATRDAVRVRIGAAHYERSIPVEDLSSGFSEQIPVGSDIVVYLSSKCPAVSSP